MNGMKMLAQGYSLNCVIFCWLQINQMQFEIVIKNEKIKSYRTIAFILLLINISAFVLMLFYDAFRYQAASAILLTTVYIIMRIYFTKKNQHGHYLDQVLMFVLAGCWLGLVSRPHVPNNMPRSSGEYEIAPTPLAAHHGKTSLPAAGRRMLKGG